jgi:threonine/homoserine/homoserine lactone efflux protein
MLGMVAALWLLAVLTPGPNLVAVLMAARRSRRTALLTVLGVGAGTGCWGLVGSLGLQVLFAAAPWLFMAFKLAGGSYLILVGVRLILAARRGAAPATPAATGQGPALAGFLTSVSNPKSALFVAGLFAATSPAGAPLGFGLMATGLMMTISLAWYGSVGCIASSITVSRLLDRSRRWIDGVAGVVFIGFGMRLVWGLRWIRSNEYARRCCKRGTPTPSSPTPQARTPQPTPPQPLAARSPR